MCSEPIDVFCVAVIGWVRVGAVVGVDMTDAALAEDDIRLAAGYKVDGRWRVIRKLGQGSFGAVFEIIDRTGKIKGAKALKLESVRCPDQVLKIEVAVLNAAKGTSHICKIYACGRNDKFNFMVMTLLGPCIGSLRKKCPDRKFSLPTSMLVTLQCVQALKDLHSVGWLHRDVKSSNFAMGQPQGKDGREARVLYMFDFGLSRYYFNKDGTVRNKRGIVGFRGTLRYCSMNAHKGMDLGRHDDLISLLYCMSEMFHGSLPWYATTDQRQVGIEKEKAAPILYTSLPNSFNELHQSLHSLVFEDAPPYDEFENAIYCVVARDKIHTTPFDWDTVARPKPRVRVQDRDGESADAVMVPEIIRIEPQNNDANPKGHKNDSSAKENGDVEDLPKSQYREPTQPKQ